MKDIFEVFLLLVLSLTSNNPVHIEGFILYSYCSVEFYMIQLEQFIISYTARGHVAAKTVNRTGFLKW
jgi:hypothetical protein